VPAFDSPRARFHRAIVHRARFLLRSLAPGFLLAACAPDDRRPAGAGGGSIGSSLGSAGDDTTTAPALPDDGGSTTNGPATSGDGDSGPDSPKLDVGDGGETGGDPSDGSRELGCQKVDLLFVIDDSISMDDEQAELIAAFPEFIDAMQAELADTDGYHIGVVTTDAYPGDPSCAPVQRGTLVTHTGGTSSSNAQCDPYSSGARYMTEQDDLAARFACAAQVGTAGDPDERPIESMLAGLSESQQAGCNQGFLRDDALLVVVIITDEEDDHEMGGCNALPGSGSSGDPLQWYAELIAAKDGDEASIVVLSIVGPAAQPFCPPLNKCVLGSTGSEIGARIIELTEMFTYGFVGSVCEPYGPQFQQAISIIDSACDDFQPPG
jgi:hypothetical protein